MHFLYIVTLSWSLILFGNYSYGQSRSLNETENAIYQKIFPFYYSNYDSLIAYSELFSTQLTEYITQHPGSIDYNFQIFADSNVCRVVTSPDSSFRIYSWNTWLGGTMHQFKNIFQFRSGGKVWTKTFDDDDGDMGTNFFHIYLLKTNGTSYYLGHSGGSESTKYAYETIKIFSITDHTLNDTLPLIKTNSGLENALVIEYDFFSVVDKIERPIMLLKYDTDSKIIYIPVVMENGQVTDQYIRYQYTGQYFEQREN